LHHLAQLKHVMPEVIVVEKIRVQDEETKCMKEDLMLKLEVDAVGSDKNVKGAAGFSQLKGIFRSRITDYFTIHPEVQMGLCICSCVMIKNITALCSTDCSCLIY